MKLEAKIDNHIKDMEARYHTINKDVAKLLAQSATLKDEIEKLRSLLERHDEK